MIQSSHYYSRGKRLFVLTVLSAMLASAMYVAGPAHAADKVSDAACKRNPSCKVVKPDNKTPEQLENEIRAARLKAFGR